MKVAYAALALMLASTSAYAWTAKTGGSGPQAIGQDGGSAAAAQSHARASSTAIQGQSTTIQGVRGGAGGAGGTGGTGGNARGGTSNVSVNNSVDGGGGGSSGGGGRAPDVIVPSVGASGLDCPTVGVGVGGSGLSGGGILSASTISSSCNQRMVATLLSNLYGPAVARAYAEQNIEGVSAAVAQATTGNHTDPKPAQVRDVEFCNRIDTQHRALTGLQISEYTEKCRF